ncbi:LuxR family transcriptional regulator [Streptomyces rapamycinicus NRRL 5491]|uniref:LuxR family transcriptional regulator n=1 Tax=Streptomyces rapamycinicus (strain ATCC 29253 / DSM 41530 / NRRL 5491 / AYB-994) TaxID=1343740 RepID=A0A3L8R7X0_STRRN|nr:LuxR family transcriptional regulator [Streptomyces rapamycinicus NRRL 5491]
MAAAHETSLVAVLGTLRASDLDDARARLAATDTASSALVALRSAQKTDRELSEEAAHKAFGQLRKGIRHMLRHHEACIEFVPPPKTGRPLPGEVAYAARAMTCAAVLAFLAQPQLTRLRIGWSSLDASLIVDVRDQGSGESISPPCSVSFKGVPKHWAGASLSTRFRGGAAMPGSFSRSIRPPIALSNPAWQTSIPESSRSCVWLREASGTRQSAMLSASRRAPLSSTWPAFFASLRWPHAERRLHWH